MERTTMGTSRSETPPAFRYEHNPLGGWSDLVLADGTRFRLYDSGNLLVKTGPNGIATLGHLEQMALLDLISGRSRGAVVGSRP